MPTPTHVALGKVLLTGTQTTITFSSIPQNYTDLLLKGSARDSGASTDVIEMQVRLAGISTANSYDSTQFYTKTTNPTSTTWKASSAYQGYVNRNSSTSNTFNAFEMYIPNYTTSSRKNLIMISVAPASTSNSNGWGISIDNGMTVDTSAVTSIDIIFPNGALANSRFDLYGIKNS